MRTFTLHVNSYSNAYVFIQILRPQKFTFTRGALAEMPAARNSYGQQRRQENSCLVYWVVIGVQCTSR